MTKFAVRCNKKRLDEEIYSDSGFGQQLGYKFSLFDEQEAIKSNAFLNAFESSSLPIADIPDFIDAGHNTISALALSYTKISQGWLNLGTIGHLFNILRVQLRIKKIVSALQQGKTEEEVLLPYLVGPNGRFLNPEKFAQAELEINIDTEMGDQVLNILLPAIRRETKLPVSFNDEGGHGFAFIHMWAFIAKVKPPADELRKHFVEFFSESMWLLKWTNFPVRQTVHLFPYYEEMLVTPAINQKLIESGKMPQLIEAIVAKAHFQDILMRGLNYRACLEPMIAEFEKYRNSFSLVIYEALARGDQATAERLLRLAKEHQIDKTKTSTKTVENIQSGPTFFNKEKKEVHTEKTQFSELLSAFDLDELIAYLSKKHAMTTDKAQLYFINRFTEFMGILTTLKLVNDPDGLRKELEQRFQLKSSENNSTDKTQLQSRITVLEQQNLELTENITISSKNIKLCLRS